MLNTINKLAVATIACWLALYTAAYAQQKSTIIRPAADGSGADIRMTNLSEEETEIVLGMDPSRRPDNVTGIIIEPDRYPRWTTDSYENIDRSFGGDGEYEIVLFDEDKSKREPKRERKTVVGREGFAGDIVPLDGRWVSVLVDVKEEGCKGPLAGIGKQASTMATTQNNDLVFGNTFHPDQLFVAANPENAQLEWKRTAANTWQTNPLSKVPGMAQVSSAMKMNVTMEMIVLDPNTISGGGLVQIEFGPAMAAIGMTGKCTVRTRGQYQRSR